VQRGVILELLGLLFQGCEALSQPGNAGCKLLLVNQALGVTIDQSGKPLPQLPDLGFERGLLLLRGPPRCGQPAAIFLGEALRMGEQLTPVVPHRHIQEIGADLRIAPDTLAPKAVGIGPETAIIGIRPRGALGSFAPDGLPV